MTPEQCVDRLIARISVWQPLEDLLSSNRALQQDALAFLLGKFDRSPFPPPEWITECMCAMTQAELRKLMDFRSAREAFEWLLWYRSERRRTLFRKPDPEPKRRKDRRGKRVPPDEQAERIALAPTMDAREFAEHFGIGLKAAYYWNAANGFLLKKRPYGTNSPYGSERRKDFTRRKEALVPTMTRKEFAEYFHVSEAAAYQYARRHGLAFRGEN